MTIHNHCGGFRPIRILVATLLIQFLLVFPTTWAADCYGDHSGPHPLVEYTWDIRQSVCGNGACNDQFDTLGARTACIMYMPIGSSQMLALQVSDTTGQYANCWDATENIIELCYRASGNPVAISTQMIGDWELGSEAYVMELYNTDNDHEDGAFDVQS
ncbi:uncharacterized protein BDZ99DRAFT_497842 [Mytilinidion resinicola]|uniref:Secreted protein n=1 Tax=Mytilinidion resinicola TaxID=574789 RepID=A0A6A6YS90_9PEZI|nr:uncharacterized protein BDZ99DRAFT_497842 [Mytilinidion resinicola]KAF2810914.1 hypothetical protein BDZ99DRAFT_497842 [Mytilinidion resinicola]